MIEIKSVSKIYHIDKARYQALQDIHLTIEKGEIFGIVGASGAGKSTLLRLINLLEKPTAGQVIVAGKTLTQLSSRQLKKERQQIGMIFQHFNLLESRTAYENIALPLILAGESKAAIKEKVMSLLTLVHLTAHALHYPAQLSGGQKQRVAIARALATNPRILLCDEPTSALDVASTTAILSLLRTINEKLGVTIVIITHELNVVKRICDRAAILDHGKLIEHGPVLDLFASPQSPITKKWVDALLHLDMPAVTKAQSATSSASIPSYLVRFTFVGKDSDLPLVTLLVKQFNLTVNIMQANIEVVQKTTIGFTVCQLTGTEADIMQALEHVKQTSIKVEVLAHHV